MKLSEHLKALKEERARKAARLGEIQSKAADENRNKDQAEQEEFDTLSGEVEAIDKEIRDTERAIKLSVVAASSAARVDLSETDDGEIDVDNPGAASAGRAQQRGAPRVQTTLLTPKLGKGILFARYARCLAAGVKDFNLALTMAKQYRDTPQLLEVLKHGLYGSNAETVIKAAVAGGTTTDATWAGPLVAYNQFAGDFIEFLRPQTIIGKFGVGNIPGLRMVPFNVHIRGQTSGGSAGWVGQAKAKPVTKFDFEDVYLEWAKIAAITVLSEDLLRFSSPSAETLVRDSLAQCIIALADTDFIDPAKGAVSHVSPASITNGISAHHSAGGTADNARADVSTAMTDFINANISPTSAVWIMAATTALQLSLLRNAFGQKEFPDITINGGMFEGVPVITSQYVPVHTAGAIMVLANAQDIWMSDDGAVTVDASREASLQMDSAPSQDAGAPTASTSVSMFQTNSVALRAERFINWKRRRDAAVSVIDQVDYTGS